MCAKSSEWPRGWQMPDPRAAQNLQMPHQGLTRLGKCPCSCLGEGHGRTWSLTDALQAAFGVSQQSPPQCVTVSPHWVI